jgi:hypothetical protein
MGRNASDTDAMPITDISANDIKDLLDNLIILRNCEMVAKEERRGGCQ